MGYEGVEDGGGVEGEVGVVNVKERGGGFGCIL